MSVCTRKIYVREKPTWPTLSNAVDCPVPVENARHKHDSRTRRTTIRPKIRTKQGSWIKYCLERMRFTLLNASAHQEI